MSFKTDIMYPFGNRFMQQFDDSAMTALRNMTTLARERIWLAEGQPITDDSIEFDTMLTDDQIECAKKSVSIAIELLDNINQTMRDQHGS